MWKHESKFQDLEFKGAYRIVPEINVKERVFLLIGVLKSGKGKVFSFESWQEAKKQGWSKIK